MTPASILRAASLALPLLGAVACDDDDEGGPDGTVLVEAVIDDDGGVVVVTDGGSAVTGASVGLNGYAGVAGATDGEYTVTLPGPVTAGGAMDLEVTAGAAAVTGAATVPATPVLTAPAQDEVFSTAQEIPVTWTADEDPDRWVVEASDGTVELFDVADGSARAFNIPAASLTADVWEIRVLAYNDGVVAGDAEAGSAMEVRAAVATSPTVIVVAPVTVTGGDMGNQFQHVSISQGGATVNGATVTVNGEAAIQSAPNASYDVTLAAPVAAGGAIDLDIAFESVVIEGTATVAESPVVTAPADNAVIAITSPVDVTWTSATDPERFVVSVDIGATVRFDVAGTARAFSIPAGTLPAGTWQIRVYAYNDGSFTGPVDSENSAMNVRSDGTGYPDVTITP